MMKYDSLHSANKNKISVNPLDHNNQRSVLKNIK